LSIRFLQFLSILGAMALGDQFCEGAGAGVAGVIETGADRCVGFGAACFLAAATAGGGGRGDGDGVFAAGAAGRGAAEAGSAVIMLTGGVEAALGNSALVGLPVGRPGICAVTGATAGAAGVLQVAE